MYFFWKMAYVIYFGKLFSFFVQVAFGVKLLLIFISGGKNGKKSHLLVCLK